MYIKLLLIYIYISRLNPFLCIVVLDVSREEFRCGLPCELLFADDLTVVADKDEEMQRRRQIGLESKGPNSQHQEYGSDGQ